MEFIIYLKDQKNQIKNYKNYNLVYELKLNQRIYMPIKQVKKAERWNYVKDIGLIVLVTMLSISMIGLTIYFYWLADTKDMYAELQSEVLVCKIKFLGADFG